MNPIKPILICLMILNLASCAPSNNDPTLEALIARHTEARGGAGAIEAVNAVAIELEITEPGFTVNGSYKATRGGFMRIDIFADGNRVFTEALGPNGGWQMLGDGSIKDLSADGLKALERGVIGNLYGLHELLDLGYKTSLIGKIKRGDHNYFELEEVAPDGFSKHLYLDAETYLMTGDVQTSALHPDVDNTEARQETIHSNFQNTGGLMFATRSEKRDLDTGAVMQSITITSRALNPEIDAAQFNRPDSQS